MKKKYVTVRLFKNHRAADGQITNEELHDSIQQQATEAMNNSQENNDTIESSVNQNESSLLQKLLSVIQRALKVLGFERKG
ncbi:hypothetical protein JT05_12125 [Desulfosporosinus sp. Tol-M]|nr:hypothetical protein JT05_12125 [Desulfosporosinus sp. Tol-M]